MTSIKLQPVIPDVYTDSNLEPQYVTMRNPIAAWVYLNSGDLPVDDDKTNCIIRSDNTTGGRGGNILASDMGRIKIAGVTSNWYIPNVNPRNNTITFHSSASGLDHTVTLTERFYDVTSATDITALIAAIITALNTATGASGLTFSSAAVTGFPRMYTISAAGGLYYFIRTCSALAKGRQMYGFDQTQTSSANHTVGPMNMMYTQFVDIVSTTMTKWSKMSTSTSGNVSPVIARAYIGGNAWGTNFQQFLLEVASSWKAREPISYIDLRFFDQNGDPLYAPNDGKDFQWQISLIVEK